MKSLMQDWPLRVHTILDHAHLHHGTGEIVTRSLEGPIHRCSYADMHLRARKVSQALVRLGINKGDALGTMAWNTWRHMEVWYGIMGAGAVCHTLNPRLFADQLVYIINHAEDKVIFLDANLTAIFEGFQDRLTAVKHYIIMTDKEHMPETTLPNVLCYEDLLAAEDGNFDWVTGDENDACGICYTSGTTGNPKGVVYSHRSNVIHTLAANAADAIGLRSVDSVMPVVPMFHANAWSIAFAAPAGGSKLVMPGANMDGASIYELLDTEQVTMTAAVPTVWMMLMQHLEANNLKLPHLGRVAIGGSAIPRSMLEAFERNYEVEVRHLWGMTEMSPIGTMAGFKRGMENLSFDECMDVKLKQGRAMYTVEMKITDDDGKELPWDGKAFGHLMVRGPAISGSYLKGEGGQILDEDGWFDTGDVATIDELGFMQITDRSKDVIKSGGEWISSIELENLAVGHPDVVEAAVIGILHPKWDERPLLIVVRKEGSNVSSDDILGYMEGKIAKWWIPDDVVFVNEIPHTATGKIQKTALREQFKDHQLPSAKAAE
ncbi:MAG: long-chain-fatty-acid--CoA ligase [Parvularculales bacterium]